MLILIKIRKFKHSRNIVDRIVGLVDPNQRLSNSTISITVLITTPVGELWTLLETITCGEPKDPKTLQFGFSS